jgi:hypothetical protein
MKFGKWRQKRMKNPKKVSFHAQNQQKTNPMCVGSVPCTETCKNEVSKLKKGKGVILVFHSREYVDKPR